MTRNEPEFLEDWIKYHGFLFGLNNIYILDGSTDDIIFKIYDRYIPLGLHVRHTKTGLNGLAFELSDLMYAHKGSGDFLIKLDTDEFLAHSSPLLLQPSSRFRAAINRKYLKKNEARSGKNSNGILELLVDAKYSKTPVENSNFADFFSQLPVTGQRYKASLTAWSIPSEGSPEHPCREISDFTGLQFTHLKSFFHSDSFLSTDLGCHKGNTTNNKGSIDTGLVLIHYFSTSVEVSIRRAREVLISHGYFDTADDFQTQKAKLLALKQGNPKLASHHKIDLYLSHLDATENMRTLNPEVLNRQHPLFRRMRSKKLTLISETLAKIDQQHLFPPNLKQ